MTTTHAMSKHVRQRRGLLEAISRGIQFHLKLPGIDWQKRIGTSNIGAEFGLVVKNELDLDIRPTKGHVLVDVDDQIYARGLLGYIGMTYDFIDAGICFKGGIRYQVNILQDFSFEELMDFIKIWFRDVPKVIRDIKSTIETFKHLFDRLAESSPEEIFQTILDTVRTFPETVKAIARLAMEAWERIAAYNNLPSFIEKAREAILRVNTLLNSVKNDVNDLLNEISDSILTVLPWAAEQIWQGVETIVQEVPKLIKSPQTAIGNIAKAAFKIYQAVIGLINIKDSVEEVFLFKEGKQPYFFNIGMEIQGILDDFMHVWDLFQSEAPDWIEGLGTHTEGVLKDAFGDMKSLGNGVVNKVNESMWVLQKQIAPIAELVGPFLEAYNATVGTIKSVERCYESLKKGYETARGIVHRIFGPKVSLKFPKKKLDPETCGGGLYPSTGVSTRSYDSRGIDLEIPTGQEVVAPFAGEVTRVSLQSITIATDEIKGMEAIVDGIDVGNSVKEGKRVEKGEVIGTAASTGCDTNTIHFALKERGSKKYVDPTKYVPSGGIMNVDVKPGWQEECNSYWLTLKGETIGSGKLSDAFEDNETPEAPADDLDRSLPLSTSVNDKSSRQRLREGIAKAIRSNPDFLQMLGVSDLTDASGVFSLKLHTIKVSTVVSIFDAVGLGDGLRFILNILEHCWGSCKIPNSLTDEQLRWELKKRGKSSMGSRDALLQRYTTSDDRCPDIFHHLNKLDSIYCRMQDNCLGFSCCLTVPIPPFNLFSLKSSVMFDPCNMSLTIELGDMKETKNLTLPRFAEEDDYSFNKSWTLFDSFKVQRSFRIKRENSFIEINLALRICSKDICLPPLKIVKGARIKIPTCHAESAAPQKNQVQLMEMTLGDLEKEITFFRPCGLDLKLPDLNLGTFGGWNFSLGDLQGFNFNLGNFQFPDFNLGDFPFPGLHLNWGNLPGFDLGNLPSLFSNLVNELRVFIKGGLIGSIEMAMQDLGIELNMVNSYLVGTRRFGPWDKIFFNVNPGFPLGPIYLSLVFGAGGYAGVDLEAGVSLMKMSAYGLVTPKAGAIVGAGLRVQFLALVGELKLTGHILTTDFPTRAEIAFNKFPLNVRVRMDMVMIPLRLELRGKVIAEISLFGKTLSKTIINILIWQYETPAVTGNIFNTGLPEPDLTPPKFRKFTFDFENGIAFSKRAAITTHCEVEQVAGRDVVEPAFQLEVAAEDDVSQVKLTYDVGTYRGGSDVVMNEDLGGPSNIIVREMKGGVPLYFTVTATNSGGGNAKVTCELPTYDVTLPGGRVTPDFLTTSHPNILRASAVAHDDSVILHKRAAVGYGRKVYGDQVLPWHDVNTTANTLINPVVSSILERFTGPRPGKVISTPVETSIVDIPEQCASECLKLPAYKCLSFNYDYGNGDCELLEEIEGHGVEIHVVGHFHHFERLGVGHSVEFRHDDLQLSHNVLYYFNFFLNNTIGYVNTLTSPGVLADFTPPSPGPLENVIMDVLMTEDCGDFVLDHWEQFKCGEQTPLPNHRWIVDGQGSRTVFNGHEPLVDMLYTRANRYVSANWDGFHDNETGLHGYSWTVGRTPCGQDVHPHIDPHAHLFDVSEWTHEGLASPLFLEDGKYHVTVRPINNVEFGGVMATTVCHTTPYTIDNTPPFVHRIHNVQYDEEAYAISAEYNVSDPLSDIREIDFGLGRTKRDVHLMDWYRHGNTTHTSVNFHIPDGVPAWVKVRAINNVDLREVGHSESPILVDTTPPAVGILYDGSVHGHDLKFTSDPRKICANWKDFHDEESGLSHYLWGVGSSRGMDDVVLLTEYPHSASEACSDVQLIHNTTYFSVLVAVNNGHKHLNVTAWSDGVLFDATPPLEGTLRDGLEPDSDLEFSSEPSTVSANWDGYSDPESDISDYAVTVQRTSLKGNFSHPPEIIHQKTSVGPVATHINWHKFHLHHGDRVSVQLEATNQAMASTLTSSNGFVMDLTKPVMVHLGDGTEPGKDREFSVAFEFFQIKAYSLNINLNINGTLTLSATKLYF
ncbi:uncharacterized protein LOC118410558 isoform X2 [Branchiostoma floridae]|uniref:Uncharacterized protein LOC118410558 isoform X2 n=1 Tax=Branchiostoma floridae TaxID=7739 RepID=A0A9J7MI68_BRAFL|nr:uncharacterized protein LOC118410558 isoform X2 [Branchiostoma floridae]